MRGFVDHGKEFFSRRFKIIYDVCLVFKIKIQYLQQHCFHYIYFYSYHIVMATGTCFYL